MKKRELKELKLTKNIIIPFPNFQPNTIISPTQINDNFEEIEYAYNNLIDLHNGVISKVEDSLNRSDETIDRVQGVENDLQDSERKRILNENTRITNESARISSENIRIENENTRNSKENTRIANEAQREQQELERISTYQTHINDEIKREEKHNQMIGTFNEKVGELDEAIASIPTKQELKGEKGDKGDKGDRGEQGVKGDTPSITHLETSINNKIQEVETRFNTLTSSQQQDAEVIDARDGETSLKARLDRDIEKAKQIYVNVEGSHISTDSSSGYLKDVEIKGNTIQDTSNLADIRSVGDKVEGQELYEIPVLCSGKNLFDLSMGYRESIANSTIGGKISFKESSGGNHSVARYVKCKKNDVFTFSCGKGNLDRCFIYELDSNDIIVNIQNIVGKTKTIQHQDTVKCVIYLGQDANNVIDFNTVQIEYGTVATEYEPYQEDKITILSPVQLEKVGDVADRIVCKDGVWGVEKNVIDVIPNTNISWNRDAFDSTNYNSFWVTNIYNNLIGFGSNRDLISCISPHIQGVTRNTYEVCDFSCISLNANGTGFTIKVPNNITTSAKLNDYLASMNMSLKARTINPQFIPLPHDQQIKLRTFANKTNISFLTEIEGTIKAQVPKSLGATVNTHTEQINNLNKELDRVKKLEESTVSTVETESDFTTVEATSGGYFEDVKLEGKTLVNHIDFATRISANNFAISGGVVTLTNNGFWGAVRLPIPATLKTNTKYTIILNILENTTGANFYYLDNNVTTSAFKSSAYLGTDSKGIITQLVETIDDFSGRNIGMRTDSDAGYVKFTYMLLEGDHTQNPPSGYIEGLKSVGQSTSEDGADEIVVSSVGENLFDLEKWIKGVSVTRGTIQNHYNGSFTLSSTGADCHTGIVASGIVPVEERCKLVNIEGNSEVTVSVSKNNTNGSIMFYGFYDSKFNVITFNSIRIDKLENTFTIKNNYSHTKYLMLRFGVEVANTSITFSNIMLSKGTTPKSYTPHISDKKRLLFYNDETQTWEKPILREWDSIEKHGDGKYYYHQRSGEVVLNGSENWVITSSQNGSDTTLFDFDFLSKNESEVLCDKFVYCDNWNPTSNEGIKLTGQRCYIRVNTSKLSTQDVTGFKQWLQANNVTVVYQLAQEKVYECTNIDLITYANETNYIVESGAISPKSTLKVHNNISNVVKILQEKVSLLENKFIMGLKQVLAGDMYSLAELLYPEDFTSENTVDVPTLLI